MWYNYFINVLKVKRALKEGFMDIAYIRVSDKGQNETRQIDMMKKKGIDDRFIFIDKQSGKNFDRKAYNSMLLVLREGDTLYIENIDRLGRNYDGILDEWKSIRNRGVHIVALDNQELFDSRKFENMGEIGKLLENQMLNIFAYVAQQERTKMLRRQKEGIAVAKKQGVKFGRPKVIDNKDFKLVAGEWVEGKITAVEAMNRLNCSKTTWYKYVKEAGIKKVPNLS
jgi:DNA invertase Pin-like site-specific DNA recombinase